MKERSNQKFKKIVDELRNNDVVKGPEQEIKDNEQESSGIIEAESDYKEYDRPSNARNLCLVCSGGKKHFFDYAYLRRGELKSSEEDNSISLYFGADVVILKGFSLDKLYEKFVLHLPAIVMEEDERYAEDSKEFTVTKIEVLEPSNTEGYAEVEASKVGQ